MKKGVLHLPQVGVRVVQGSVRALFYTKFTRKKGTLLSLGEMYTPNTPLNPPLEVFPNSRPNLLYMHLLLSLVYLYQEIVFFLLRVGFFSIM
jgi:hypothetical protein